jgi:hypothetical protein
MTMPGRSAENDWWLVMLVVAIFVAGITIYVGWDDVGSLARKARLFVFSHL